jgi:nitrogen fixation protein NifU and related proteins
MYNEKTTEYFSNPKNQGELEKPDGIAEVQNPTCGDSMRVSIKVEDGEIKDAKFMANGCNAAVATNSMATEMIVGKTLEEAYNINHQSVTDALNGLPDEKVHCSSLAERAVRAAIEDYYVKNNIPFHSFENNYTGSALFSNQKSDGCCQGNGSDASGGCCKDGK